MEERIRILLVEDELKVASFLKQGLEESGYEVVMAYDGEMGKKLALEQEFQILILDVIIPYINGLELCKLIRSHQIDTPIILLTALGTIHDKLQGFETGADDYIVKPFDFKELLARIRALLKRKVQIKELSNQLQFADLILDLDTQTAFRKGVEIQLTAKEYALLEYLMRNPKRVIKRDELESKVWGLNFSPNTNVVDVYVTLLRKKVDKNFELKLIRTQIGKGYILDDKV
jgi:two-component system, OmpR family, copper resistance phosphate regulon response regulator CusR